MLNPSDYILPQTIWTGISRYVQEHFECWQELLSAGFTDDDLLSALKISARNCLSDKEYDTFRKAVTALRKGTAATLKRENLYRLCYVLRLESDLQAQELFLYFLHFNELSARSLDEFIILSSLKLQLSWKETCEIRRKYQPQILAQPACPSMLCEGQTAETYQRMIQDTIRSVEDLCHFLDAPEHINFFARTRNTQFLALFDDVKLEVLYHGDCEQLIRLVTNYGDFEQETVLDYYHSLFGLQLAEDDQYLTDREISALCSVFGHVFMTYDHFLLLVQRKRAIEISSGTFLLGLLKKLLTDDLDEDHDFYMNFLDEEDFVGICDDILLYFGFPVLNPECDRFERLLLDVYWEVRDTYPDISNMAFQRVYLERLREYLREIANLQSS